MCQHHIETCNPNFIFWAKNLGFFRQNNSFSLVNMKLISVKWKYGKHITRNSRSSTDPGYKNNEYPNIMQKKLTSWFN